MSKPIQYTIKKAPYNPRKMSKTVKKALQASLDNFDDLSGIVINKKTGNILSGNHRWGLLEDKWGKLSLKQVHEDRYMIMAADKQTGFIARLVNWSEKKEKQANIVANSPMIQGEFDENLQPLLHEISEDEEQSFLDDLMLTDMTEELDSDVDADLDFEDDDKRTKTVESENKRSNKNEDKPEHSEVRQIIQTLKITTPAEFMEDIHDTIIEALSEKPYYDKLQIS